MTADVTVYGAGILGLSCAWACVQRGAAVTVIDPHGPGAGSSGGIVGALAPHVPENWNPKKQFQLDSLLMAESWWTEVANRGGVDAGYSRLGRVQPLADAAAVELAQARATTAPMFWHEAAVWRVTSDAGAFAPHSPTGLYVFDSLSARLHPRQACAALRRALEARGASIKREGSPRGKTIWATGWQGLLDLNDVMGRKIGDGVKGQAVLLAYDAAKSPQLFCDGLHIVPHADGTVAIGSTTEREFTNPTSTDQACDTLIQQARQAVPALADATILETWAGVRPRARSRAPLVGAWPGRPGHFVLNGGFKIGFGMAPKLAECMADLVLEGVDCFPDGFRLPV